MLIYTSLGNDANRLENISPINVIVGRNGSGKSRFFRALSSNLAASQDYLVRYISPERGGTFKRQSGVEDAMRTQPNYLRDSRQRNQVENFKTGSAVLLRQLEHEWMYAMQHDVDRRAGEATFQTEQLDKINALLTGIELVQKRDEIAIQTKDGLAVSSDDISSGESEAIALATEFLFFILSVNVAKFNVFLLDEPDVHLHPDLQSRLSKFIVAELAALNDEAASRTAVCIATHSTAMIAGLALSDACSVGTKYFTSTVVARRPIADQLRKVAPFFAHPLSQSLSNDVLLIVEGEDDERIWQQAGRTAEGRIKLYPCVASTVTQQTELERFCADWLGALYDNPIALSLRDGDGKIEALDPVGPVLRFRLACYEMENLLLTEDALLRMGSTWEAFLAAANQWVGGHPGDERAVILAEIIKDRGAGRHIKIKSVRELICKLCGSQKHWTLVLGQCLGTHGPVVEVLPHTIADYVGRAALTQLLSPRP